jgi:hypothetical protein
MKLKILRVALERQDYNLAAHVLVYGLVKAKAQENNQNGKKRSPQGQPERSQTRIL